MINTLLEVFLLDEDSLLTEVVQQLKRIASFERLLFFELDKLTIVSDVSSLEKVSDTVKRTFRLNEIAREVSFCKDSNITLDSTKMNGLLTEVLNNLYSLFFTIYNPSKHFRYPDFDQSPEKRFKDAFVSTKTQQWDTCFKMNENAINRPFQKIFNILKTSEVLLRTLWWILGYKTDFSPEQRNHTLAIRLIMMTMIVFTNKNIENQEFCSTAQDFIRLFYNQVFVNQSCDYKIVFIEMMRDNKRLLKLPLKYLYDITMTTMVEKLSLELTNNYSSSHLVATLMSCDYIVNCNLPTYKFDPIEVLRKNGKRSLNLRSSNR